MIRVAGGGDAGLSIVETGTVRSDDPVVRGRALFSRAPAICSTCHSLEPDVVIVGPSLIGLPSRAAQRIAGMSAEQYIRQSIISPGEYVVAGFPDAMAKNLASQLSSEDINDLIAFLMTLEGDE